MTRRTMIWLGAGVLFTLGNLLGAGLAAVQGELVHASIHIGLLLLGAIIVWALIPRSPRVAGTSPPRELADRLTQLEQSVDAVAIEVERIGEGQRHITRIFSEKGAERSASTVHSKSLDVHDETE